MEFGVRRVVGSFLYCFWLFFGFTCGDIMLDFS